MQHLRNSGRRLIVLSGLSVVGMFAVGQSPALAAAPVAGNDAYSTPAGTTLNVAAPGVLANDSDADGDTLTAGMPSNPGSGTLILSSNGGFSYTPKAGFTGIDSFTYMVHGDDGGAMPTATVTITVGSGGGGGGTPPTLSISDKSVVEGDTGTTKGILFTVTRSGSTAAASSVTYSTANGSAMAGSDYKAVAGTVVNFAVGVASKTVKVVSIGDAADEADETFSVNLSAPTGATIADGSAIGTIVDDDGATSGSSFSISDVRVTEGNAGTSTTATLTVTRTSGAGTASVKFVTANGTAVAASDYTARTATTLSFAAGETSKTVTVTVLGDNVDEPNETFFVKLSSPTNATIADLKGIATIVDND